MYIFMVCCTEGKKFASFCVGTMKFYVDYMGFLVHQVRSKLLTITVHTHTKLLPLGRHCCLWCLIKYSQLKQSPVTRGLFVPRSTASICRDYNGFVRAGNNIKEAKCHNNVIQQPFFKSLPLSQVCLYAYILICLKPPCQQTVDVGMPPGLHITLGIFLRLFVLLEDDFHKLDLLANLQWSQL